MVPRAAPWRSIRRSLAPRWCCQALLCCGVLAFSPALAAQSASDRVAAEALYNDALRLLEARELEAACLKLEESQRLDPGLGALLYLGECYRQLGRTASAWATFRDAAYRAREAGDEREAVALELAESMKSQLSYITIEVPADPHAALQVERGGKSVGRALWGTAIPVDPGQHRIEVSAPGFEPWSATVAVGAEPVRHTLRVPALRASPSLVVAPVPNAEAGSLSEPSRVWPWALIGVGVAGLAGATVFSLRARSSDSDADEHCRRDDPSLCNEMGLAASQQASRDANIAGASALLGVAAMGTGVALWLLGADKSERPSGDSLAVGAAFGADQVSLSVRGSW